VDAPAGDAGDLSPDRRRDASFRRPRTATVRQGRGPFLIRLKHSLRFEKEGGRFTADDEETAAFPKCAPLPRRYVAHQVEARKDLMSRTASSRFSEVAGTSFDAPRCQSSNVDRDDVEAEQELDRPPEQEKSVLRRRRKYTETFCGRLERALLKNRILPDAWRYEFLPSLVGQITLQRGHRIFDPGAHDDSKSCHSARTTNDLASADNLLTRSADNHRAINSITPVQFPATTIHRDSRNHPNVGSRRSRRYQCSHTSACSGRQARSGVI
jgi:hypothetical protein